jgi:hypothetical protein
MTMPRDTYRPLAVVGLVAALLGYVGCSSKSPPKPTENALAPKAEAKTAEAKKKPEAPKELFADGPRPDGVLIISGEQLGYLEPCGCTQGQLGGLLRRYDLVERLKSRRKWPVALVDLGSLVKDPAAARGGPEQTKIKFATALKALGVMKYDAVALSPEDLKVGVEEVVGQLLNLQGDKPKVVAANVAAAALETRVVPSVRASAGPIRLGITAVVDPERIKAIRDPALDLLTVKPIDDALPAVLADLEKDTDTQVLLVQAAPEAAKALAAKYPGFDIVVGTSLGADPDRDATPLNGGKTLLVNVGQKGKYVGAVALYRDQDPSKKQRYERVTLDTVYDGPASAMKKLIEDEFRDTLKTQGVVENFPRHDYVGVAPGSIFVGADNCKSCHPKSYDKWAATGHANAFDSLLDDPKPNTAFDAECVTCHTTGFEYTSGWKSPTLTAYLMGNQCENCHGPGSKHCEQPDNKDYLAAMHLTAEQADKNRLCLRCHDEDNSPHFDFDKYWRKIDHKGLDSYTDPAVHKGRPAVMKNDGK